MFSKLTIINKFVYHGRDGFAGVLYVRLTLAVCTYGGSCSCVRDSSLFRSNLMIYSIAKNVVNNAQHEHSAWCFAVCVAL